MEVVVTKAEPIQHILQVDISVKEAIANQVPYGHIWGTEAESPHHEVTCIKEVVYFLGISYR